MGHSYSSGSGPLADQPGYEKLKEVCKKCREAFEGFSITNLAFATQRAQELAKLSPCSYKCEDWLDAKATCSSTWQTGCGALPSLVVASVDDSNVAALLKGAKDLGVLSTDQINLINDTSGLLKDPAFTVGKLPECNRCER